MRENNIKVGINVDKTELKETLDLVRKLKYELFEVNKALKSICKLGISKRRLKTILRDYFK